MTSGDKVLRVGSRHREGLRVTVVASDEPLDRRAVARILARQLFRRAEGTAELGRSTAQLGGGKCPGIDGI